MCTTVHSKFLHDQMDTKAPESRQNKSLRRLERGSVYISYGENEDDIKHEQYSTP